ncbi:hypothetical protein BDC45DRAFT_90875 [Circinella umbellata]|nr:hypothetical protein BDC45DRAFT_90875 [Circinella umbellata]
MIMITRVYYPHIISIYIYYLYIQLLLGNNSIYIYIYIAQTIFILCPYSNIIGSFMITLYAIPSLI